MITQWNIFTPIKSMFSKIYKNMKYSYIINENRYRIFIYVIYTEYIHNYKQVIMKKKDRKK